MELRHLRCFLAVAEELHFARAAEKLHIEQSPLSRAVKELEEELGVVLFARTTRSTRLTRAGKLFFEHVPRVFSALQQARDSVKAASATSKASPASSASRAWAIAWRMRWKRRFPSCRQFLPCPLNPLENCHDADAHSCFPHFRISAFP